MKKITRIMGLVTMAAAALTLGGCFIAVDDDDGASTQEICGAYCDQWQGCWQEDYEATFSSDDECRNDCADEENDYFEDFVDGECEAYARELHLCINQMDCDEYDSYVNDDNYGTCVEEWDLLYECGEY